MLDSDSSDDNKDSDEDDVKLIHKMKSKNELIRIVTLGKLKKDLQRYLIKQSKLSLVDIRLLTGIINKGFKQKTCDT